VLEQAAERGQAWELPPELIEQNEVVRALGAECLVPILGSQPGHLQGLLVLGPRLSEEPYSSEDRRLLTSVASQAGVVLRSICLAERMAERMEADRRAAHEIELAREVQRKLLPQKQPPLATLDYAGLCLQARVVGGDYYDFLELAAGQVGFVLADIAGKGFAAALLMANLQANLRSQFPLALQDLPALLRSVNRLFYENTEPSHYATFLFARYEDAQRKLTYANCGHNPPLVVRVNGNVEQLRSTATVLGLFPDWECSVAEVQLAAGDALVMYTDGVTEAEDGSGEEFGISRLANEIRRHADAPASALLDHIVSAVRRFSEGEQADDITLVVARCR
jgi:serine phosphatase RsbU (regulator of sigma subunit)